MRTIQASVAIVAVCVRSVWGQCSCDVVGRIAISNAVISDHVYDLPEHAVKETKPLSDLPTVIELIIGTAGSVCSFKLVRTPEPDLIRGIEESIRKWTFHPVFREEAKTSTATCFSSRLFLYAARKGKRLVWDIPGVSDRGKSK